MKIMSKMIHDIQAKESEKEMLHTLQPGLQQFGL
jgi:hypothetical protein